MDPTTSAFHLDPGAFFAQKRHIRLAWDHCKPSRLSSYPGILRFRWPGYRFETRWPPVGHIDAHSRWQMSRCTARRALVAPSAAPAACSQVIRATCQRRARRASARHATWPQEAALAASLAPGQVCDPRPVPARSLRWPPWSPGTHAQYSTSLAHLRCRACRPALTAKPAVRPAGGCCGGGLTDKVPGQGGHECNGRPWEALCGCSGRDDKLSCAAAQISMS